MVAAVISKVRKLDPQTRQAVFELQLYVEEFCGRDGCPGECMGFDYLTQCEIAVPFEAWKNHETFQRAMKDALVAHCRAKYPFKHEIPEDEIFLCPSTF
jgi:hypothetical protein